MNNEIREWLNKADADARTALRELEVQDHPNFDAVCFHAQQCVEKMMKAVLISRGVSPPYTHDLVLLSAELAKVAPEWQYDDVELYRLTRGAVQFR